MDENLSVYDGSIYSRVLLCTVDAINTYICIYDYSLQSNIDILDMMTYYNIVNNCGLATKLSNIMLYIGIYTTNFVPIKCN